MTKAIRLLLSRFSCDCSILKLHAVRWHTQAKSSPMSSSCFRSLVVLSTALFYSTTASSVLSQVKKHEAAVGINDIGLTMGEDTMEPEKSEQLLGGDMKKFGDWSRGTVKLERELKEVVDKSLPRTRFLQLCIEFALSIVSRSFYAVMSNKPISVGCHIAASLLLL